MARLILTSLLAQASVAASVHLSMQAAFAPAFRRERCSKDSCLYPSPCLYRHIIISRRRVATLHLSHDTASNLSTIPLSKLLELLHQRNIRYAPSASREELEALLLNHFVDIKEHQSQKPANEIHQRKLLNKTKRSRKSKGVVDAEVLPDQPRSDSTIEERRRRADVTSNNRSVRKRRINQRSYGADDRSFSGYETKRRKKRQNQYPEDNIIDAVFDLPDSQDESETYQNGLQIFLMGFAEAGKTAVELAVDAAKSSIIAPLDDNRREVISVDDIDYREYYEKPRRPRRRRPERQGRHNREIKRHTEQDESKLLHTKNASSMNC